MYQNKVQAQIRTQTKGQINSQQAALQKLNSGALGVDWVIWLLALLCVGLGLGTYGVLNNNEGLYASIPLDMLYSGELTHWIIPHLNGLPYMEKPPMMYWLTAIALMIFGQSEWVVRLVPALAGLACVGMMLYAGQRLQRPKMGRLAALMFISGFGVMCIARTLLFDMLLTAFLTGACLFAYFFLVEDRKRDLRIAYACLAFGVLTKGFVAVILCGLIIIAWLFSMAGWSAWRRLGRWFEPVAIGLLVAIMVPWFVAASLVESIFPWFFFINEHVLRFLGERMPHDYYSGPWWYYLPRVIIYLFPWSLLWPIVLCSRRPTLFDVELNEVNFLKKIFFLGWVIPLIFFSLSSNKANYYVIVAMPFFSLHLALMLERANFLWGKRTLLLGILMAFLLAAVALILHFYGDRFLSAEAASEMIVGGMSLKSFALTALWFAASLSLVAAFFAWRFPRIGLVAYVVVPFFFLGLCLTLLNTKEASFSDRPMASFIQHTLANHTVYLYRDFEQNSSLTFYLKESLNVIDSRSNDLYWGNKLRPENTIMLTTAQFEKETKPAAVVVPDSDVSEFIQNKWRSKFVNTSHYGRVTLFY